MLLLYKWTLSSSHYPIQQRYVQLLSCIFMSLPHTAAILTFVASSVQSSCWEQASSANKFISVCMGSSIHTCGFRTTTYLLVVCTTKRCHSAQTAHGGEAMPGEADKSTLSNTAQQGENTKEICACLSNSTQLPSRHSFAASSVQNRCFNKRVIQHTKRFSACAVESA